VVWCEGLVVLNGYVEVLNFEDGSGSKGKFSTRQRMAASQQLGECSINVIF
jgi:hypothetical protein